MFQSSGCVENTLKHSACENEPDSGKFVCFFSVPDLLYIFLLEENIVVKLVTTDMTTVTRRHCFVLSHKPKRQKSTGLRHTYIHLLSYVLLLFFPTLPSSTPFVLMYTKLFGI